jgi:type 1 glutamine amidotransferase
MSSARRWFGLAVLSLASACGDPGNPDGAKPAPDEQPSAKDAAAPVHERPDVADAKAPVVVADATPATAADAALTADASRATGEDSAPVDRAPTDAGAPAQRPPLVFVFTNTTGYRHDSIPAEAAALKSALGPLGITVEMGADPKVFTPAELGRFGAVILLNTTGMPLGTAATDPLAALSAFVTGGGGLVGIHAASSTFYDPAQPWVPLIGGKFVDHPGSVRAAICHTEGTFAAIARLPKDFPVRDEIYTFSNLRADNQIDLRCDAFTGGGRLPIAWHRTEGAGRVFYTALGHDAAELAAGQKLLADHVLPGILWALGREP